MVLFDVGFAFLAGGALGWRTEGERPELPLACAGLGIAPAGLAFLERYPDWDWQYFIDPSTLPTGSAGIYVAVLLLAAWGGHWIGGRRPGILLPGAALFGIYLLLTLPRTLHVGDLAAWQAGTAPLMPMEFLIFGVPWFGLSGVVLVACALAAERYRSER